MGILNYLKLKFKINKNLFDFNNDLLNYEIKLTNPTIRFLTNNSGIHLGFLRSILGKELFNKGCELIEEKFKFYKKNLKKRSSFCVMLADIKFYLPDNILYISDQTSMA